MRGAERLFHRRIWDEIDDNEFLPPENKPLTLVSYRADDAPEAFVEPCAVGGELIEMPLFLSPDTYIPVPLASTYDSAFGNMPEIWKKSIDRSTRREA